MPRIFSIVAATIAIILMTPATAHEATNTVGEPQGWAYPAGCCYSAALSPNGDCAPIAASAVHAGQGGYSVSLGVGQHPQLRARGYSGIVPYSAARPSQDADFHICLARDGANRFCFFAPPVGV